MNENALATEGSDTINVATYASADGDDVLVRVTMRRDAEASAVDVWRAARDELTRRIVAADNG